MRKTLIIAAALLLAAGCLGRRPKTKPVEYKTASPEALLAAYNENAARLTTLSARLEMTFFYSSEGRQKKNRVSAWLDAEKPGKLRLKHDALGRDLFYIVSNGEEFWIGLDKALAAEDTIYTGTFEELREESFLRPDRLLTAFSLKALPPEGTAATVLETYFDRYVLTFVDGSQPPAVLSKATFGREDLALSRYQVFDEESRLALDVSYRTMQNVSGAMLPDLLLITWPLDDFSILAKVRRATVGEPLSPQLWEFNFNWRREAEIIGLGPGQFIEIQ